MTNRYADTATARKTPQDRPIPGSDQVKNSAGGYSFKVDDWKRLERFLILGNEGGSYYASERKMTLDNANVVRRCLRENGVRTVEMIVAIAVTNRAPKPTPSIFALAMASAEKDKNVRDAAFAALPVVARTATQLFDFLNATKEFRSWGRAMRRAVANWYEIKGKDGASYQVVKYRNREGWTHRDAVRCAHFAGSEKIREVIDYVAKGKVPETGLITDFERLNTLPISEKEVIRILRSNGSLTWEMIPNFYLKSKEVWEVLLENINYKALLRNLGRLGSIGLVKPMDDAGVASKIADEEAIKKSGIHPIAVLSALLTYSNGHGSRGGLEWEVNRKVVSALDKAFRLSFGNVEPTGKRILLALDVSGSMNGGEIAGVPGLTPAVGSAAMAVVMAATEKNSHVMAFSDKFIKTKITGDETVNGAVDKLQGIEFGRTDCSLPMLYAMEHDLDVDCFVVYTDSETWYGPIHPMQALKQYRHKTGINAKLIVVGMVANEFSIADPEDFGSMDVAGFDASTPAVISDFIRS